MISDFFHHTEIRAAKRRKSGSKGDCCQTQGGAWDKRRTPEETNGYLQGTLYQMQNRDPNAKGSEWSFSYHDAGPKWGNQ